MNRNINDWFTVEKIDDDTYAISEYKHWEETHCYLLLGLDRAILIDTGLGVGNIKAVVDSLTNLPLFIVTTHAHWDHIGGHQYFAHFAVHEAERDWLAVKFPLPLQAVKHNLTFKPCEFPKDFSLERYQIFHRIPQQLLHDRDCLDLGGRRLNVVHTPGHSPGHCCFYEPDRQYLYSGDLIYSGCLNAFYPSTDPEQFYRSVQKVCQLNVRSILPGHHQLDLAPSLICNVERGFHSLFEVGLLKQGSGIFDFGGFQIHI